MFVGVNQSVRVEAWGLILLYMHNIQDTIPTCRHEIIFLMKLYTLFMTVNCEPYPIDMTYKPCSIVKKWRGGGGGEGISPKDANFQKYQCAFWAQIISISYYTTRSGVNFEGFLKVCTLVIISVKEWHIFKMPKEDYLWTNNICFTQN